MKLRYNEMVSNFAFNFNLRHYNKVQYSAEFFDEAALAAGPKVEVTETSIDEEGA